MSKTVKRSALLLISLLLVFAATNAESSIDELLFPKYSAVIKTDAAIVMKDGKIVYERYGNGYTAASKHLSWSLAKTVTGILVGVAVDQGYLNYTDSVRKWFPQFKGTATVLDVLQMSSGIGFQEEYFGHSVDSEVVRMLYLEGPKKGFADFVTSLPLRSKDGEPGKHFYYSSGDTNVLMEILRLSMPKEKYDSFPWDALFKPLGIEGAVLERDIRGMFIGSSYLYMKPHDYLRLGELVMNRGVFGGKRIIPEAHFKLMSEVAPGVNVAAAGGTTFRTAYSAMARTNLPIPGRNCGSEFPDLPLDTVILFGHQGMVVAASPSQKLIVLRLSVDRGSPTIRPRYFGAVRKFLQGRGIGIESSLPTDNRECISTMGEARRWIDAQKLPAIEEYKKTPVLLRQLATKEMCSCLFVMGRTEEQCHSGLRMTFPYVVDLAIDVVGKTVSAGTEFLSQARYEGDRYGCRLVTSL